MDTLGTIVTQHHPLSATSGGTFPTMKRSNSVTQVGGRFRPCAFHSRPLGSRQRTQSVSQIMCKYCPPLSSADRISRPETQTTIESVFFPLLLRLKHDTLSLSLDPRARPDSAPTAPSSQPETVFFQIAFKITSLRPRS